MMRRSAGMGGGRMLRAMGWAVGGVKEKMSSGGGGGGAKVSKPACVVSLSGSSPPLVALGSRKAISCCLDAEEWERVGEEADTEMEMEMEEVEESGRFIFGPVPSKEEVEEAVSTLQQIFVPVTFSQFSEVDYPYVGEDVVDKVVNSTDGMHGGCLTASNSDWIEPPLHLQSLNSSQAYKQEKVLETFRLLQVNPSIQKMVVSLSCDKAVWDAVMNNEIIQEYKKTLDQAQSTHSSDEGNDNHTGTLRWNFESTKGKLMEFFDKISKLVNEIFHSDKKNKDSETFDDFVRSSFMLAVVVFIVVVVTRGQQA